MERKNLWKLGEDQAKFISRRGIYPEKKEIISQKESSNVKVENYWMAKNLSALIL